MARYISFSVKFMYNSLFCLWNNGAPYSWLSFNSYMFRDKIFFGLFNILLRNQFSERYCNSVDISVSQRSVLPVPVSLLLALLFVSILTDVDNL